MGSSLISAESLNQLMLSKNNKLVILYTTMDSGPGVKPEEVQQAPNLRIPASLFFDFQYHVVDKASNLRHMMPPLREFEEAARELGINDDSEIVIYDDFGNFCASRVWFMFKSAGHQNVRVLDGGLLSWLTAAYPTETGCIKASNRGQFVAQQSTDYRFVDASSVLDNIDNEYYQVLDARGKQRFLGLQQEHSPELRTGHIPKAKNLHYAQVLDDEGKFKSTSELAQLFSRYHDNLIFSCGSGVTACILAQAADLLSIKPLLVYDGSWAEWGADPRFPIEQ